MSQENLEAVRRMWDAWQAGDVQTALSIYDPDVEWDGTNLPDGRVARGHEAVMDHIRRWAEQWDDWTVEVERIVDAGSEQVVLFMRERGRSKSGLDMDERHAELYTCRDGKVIRRQGFSDPNEALEAAGLSEEAMSQENVEIIRQAYEAANRDDVDSAVADFAPDCEYVPSGKFPTDEVYRGPEGFKRFIAWLTDAFDEVHLDTHELVASDDKVFVHQTNSGRGKMSGAEASWELWLVWTLREGKIVRGQAFTTREQALEAAGLRE